MLALVSGQHQHNNTGCVGSFMNIYAVDAYLLIGLGIVIGITLSTVLSLLPVRSIDRPMRQYAAKVILGFIEIPALVLMVYIVAK
jgi:hypothetical protein